VKVLIIELYLVCDMKGCSDKHVADHRHANNVNKRYFDYYESYSASSKLGY